MAPPRIGWSPQDYAAFGRKTQLFDHSYHQLPLFEKSAAHNLARHLPTVVPTSLYHGHRQNKPF